MFTLKQKGNCTVYDDGDPTEVPRSKTQKLYSTSVLWDYDVGIYNEEGKECASVHCQIMPGAYMAEKKIATDSQRVVFAYDCIDQYTYDLWSAFMYRKKHVCNMADCEFQVLPAYDTPERLEEIICTLHAHLEKELNVYCHKLTTYNTYRGENPNDKEGMIVPDSDTLPGFKATKEGARNSLEGEPCEFLVREFCK